MSTPSPGRREHAKQQALDVLARLITNAKSAGGTAATMADFGAALGDLRDLDPAMQRRIAKAMLTSRGDAVATRAAMDELPADDALEPPEPPRVPAPRTVRTPTVVDARGGVPWIGLLVAAIAAVATAALLASNQ